MKLKKIKKIIHIDMDAFFAAVAIRDNPSLKGKPVIVGAPPNSRGVVATCSYEARKFGVHSGMASSIAGKKCPHGIFVKSNWEAIKEASQITREIFYKYTDLVEPASLDEAYLDVTENKLDIPTATEIARQIKQEIFTKTKLTASAGVSYNKFLAKIGSDMNKPDGLTVIPPEKAIKLLEELPIRKFHGIGKATEKKMLSLGIKKGLDLKNFPLKILEKHFGKIGHFYYQIVRGIDNREVKPFRERKSIGSERTFSEDTNNIEYLLDFLKTDADKIASRMEKYKCFGKTITLKIKYKNFEVITRNITLDEWTRSPEKIFFAVKYLLSNNLDKSRQVRLLGIGISNLKFEDDEIWYQTKIDEIVDNEQRYL